MPQLDFFSFTHQFLFFILSFYGLYYFNLLILFPEIRWQYFEKLFFLRFLSYDIYYFNRWALGVITMKLYAYWIFLHETIHFNYLTINSVFVWNVSSVWSPKYPSLKELTLLTIITCLMLLFFFKNIIVFSAEKLMFIYFIYVSFMLFFFLIGFFKNLLKKDLWVVLDSIINLESKTEYYIFVMKNLARDIIKYIIYKTKYSLLINSLKIKQINLN